MATPFVVQKLPLASKNLKDCETCLKSPKNRNQCNVEHCLGGCGFACSTWCQNCDDPLKYHFPLESPNTPHLGLAQVPHQISRPMTAQVEKRGRASPRRLDTYSKMSPERCKSDQMLMNSSSVSHQYSPKRSIPSSPRISSPTWKAVTKNGVHEKYLQEVEALRGKLRELRGSAPRKLPQPPVEGKSETSSKASISTYFTTSANSAKTSVTSIRSSSYHIDDVESEKHPESKTSWESGEPHYPLKLQVTPTVTASVKRPRDKSPLINREALKKINDIDMTIETLSRSSNSVNVSKKDNVVGSTLLEKENGDKLLITLNENNVISCSITSASKNSSPSKFLSGIGDFEGDPVKCLRNVGPSYGEIKEKSVVSPYSMSSISKSPHLALEHKISSESSSIYSGTLGESSSDETLMKSSFVRCSLFSFVPPYVKFYAHDEKGSELPKSIQKALRWKLTTITPLVVRHTVTNSGFRLDRRTNEWVGVWGRHMKSVCFRTLSLHQKINHLPGSFQIGRKDKLWKNIFRFMGKYGKKEFGFIPRTYILPQDMKALKHVWDRNGSKNKWIVKPPAAARGTGIKVINKWTQIPKKIPIIVQKYISNPYLINGNKFDLRLYVLVTSFNPLRIYLFTNGLVRFASVKYSDEPATLTNRYMHLTNYSINKLSNNYAQNEDAEACIGHKWTIRSLWSYLEGSVNIDALWESLVDLIIKTLITGETSMSNLASANLNSRYSAYELFGFDVLLDEHLKPWLLEVNISPSLHSTSPLDIAVKGPLIKDILNIVGYHIPNNFTDAQKVSLSEKIGISGPLCNDPDIYIPDISPTEKAKHLHFSQFEDREMYINSILEELTPDDVRRLIIYEDELTQIGGFQKVFPTSKTHRYHTYFEDLKYYDRLFDAWESKYFEDRQIGINLLETKCRMQIHLDVADVEPRPITFCHSDTSVHSEKSEKVKADSHIARRARFKTRQKLRLSRGYHQKRPN